MPTNCEIYFDGNLDRVFYGGQIVSGRVELSLTKEKIVRGIFIELSGKAYCHWTEGTGNKKKTHTGQEVYLDERIYFVGDRNGELTIAPGTYHYTFQYSLPHGLPTSFEGHHGYIRYTTTATLDRPRWPDQTYEKIFTVIKPLNLNEQLQLRNPVVETFEKHFNRCCLFWCCSTEPLLMTARIPVSGYTPGQNINVELELTNNSDENVSAFVLQLIREVRFQTHADSTTHKNEREIIVEKTTRECYAHQNQKYTIELMVPPTPPTDSTSSNICKLSYHMLIEGSTGCCHMNPVITFPITIGSYPILDEPPKYSQSILPILPSAPKLAGMPITHSTKKSQPLPTAPFPENDPPAYEQALKVGDKTFAPNYPVYRRATSYSSNNSTN